MFPDMKGAVFGVKEGDTFAIAESEAVLKIVETPGHKTDHISFILTDPKEAPHNILFPGDAVLGSPSVSCDNLVDYMNSLKKLYDLNAD